MKLKDAFDPATLPQTRMAESVQKHMTSAIVQQEKTQKVKCESSTDIQALVDTQQE